VLRALYTAATGMEAQQINIDTIAKFLDVPIRVIPDGSSAIVEIGS